MTEQFEGAGPPIVAWDPPRDEASAFPATPRSARVRSRITVVSLAAAGVVSLLATVTDIGAFDLIYQAQAGTLADSEAAAWSTSSATITLLQLGAIVVAAICYLAWLSRSVENVPALTGRKPVALPLWSIVWWFVPIANLFKPFQIVDDLYRRTLPPGRRAATIVAAWWVLWVLNVIATVFAEYSLATAEYFRTLELAVFLYFVGDVVGAAAACLAIVIVLRIQFWADWRQSRLARSSRLDLASASAG